MALRLLGRSKMKHRIGSLIGAAALAALVGAGSSQAATLFQLDPNPNGTKLFVDKASDASSSAGTVVSNDDVSILVSGKSNFANGFSTIKPAGDAELTTLIFTPTNPDEFDGFSFRVQDDQGNAPQTIAVSVAKANADFSAIGVIAALKGETIKSVELVNDGGFKEAKQFEFNPINAAGVPEPATWAMMLVGFGGLGAVMRRRRQLPA
jgi:hypothetical protein